MKQSTDLAAEVFAILRCEFFDANLRPKVYALADQKVGLGTFGDGCTRLKKFNCFRHFQHFIQHFSEIRTFLIHYIGISLLK